MIEKLRNTLSIRSSVVLLFSGVIILTGLSVGYLVFTNWISSANTTVAALANALTEETSGTIIDFLHEPQHLNQINHKLIEAGVINLHDARARDRFFVSVIGSQDPYLYSFTYGSETGEYYGARRITSGEIEIIRNDDKTDHQSWYYSVGADGSADKLVSKTDIFDPRTRDWYKGAKAANKPVFSSPYKHFIMDDLAISAAYPLYDEHNELMGVLGTHLLLSDLEKFLSEGAQPNEGEVVIVERTTGELIANTYKRPNYQTDESGAFERLKIESLNVPSIENAYTRFVETGAYDEADQDVQDGTYVHISAYSNEGVEWLIISAVSNDVLMREVSKNIALSVSIAFFSGFIALLSYFFLTKRFMTPLTELVETSNKIAAGDFGERVTVRRYDEIGVLGQAFNDMAQRMAAIVDDLEKAVSVRTAEIQESHDELRQHQDTLQLILDSTAEAIYGIDLDGNCMFCNRACLQMLGYQSQSELLGKNMHWLIHHSTVEGDLISLEHCRIFTAFTTGQSSHVDDEVFWKADGSPLEVEYYSYPQYNNGELVGAVITFMDNSERRRHEEQIQFLSTRDSLTGLYNRRHFETMLASLDRPSQLPLSILFADTNGLKLTNDVFGHAAGDELVVACAEALTSTCRETDVVARVGGDEFVVLLPQTSSEDAALIQERIELALSEHQIAAVRCSMSMGHATKESADEPITEVLEAAENAMYRQKTFDRQALDAAMIETLMHSLYTMAPLEREHAQNVSTYATLVGQELKMSPSDIKKLTEAALLHDIGKVAIESEVMNSSSPLGDLEREEMKRHTTVGFRILNLFDETLALAEDVYAHHEHWDGSGYPKGLKGTEIPLAARIITVAETYDALRSARGNRHYENDEALEIIERLAGTKFDPAIVDAFIRVIGNLD